MTKRPMRALLLVAAMALVAAACSQSSDTTTTSAPAAEAPPTTAEAPSDTSAPADTAEAPPDTEAPPTEVSFDVGVTAEPCPEGNPDHGCIYLGILTDETGPFAGASPALVGGHKAFWATVNAEGGIADQFDVAVSDDFKRDTGYVPEAHVSAYAEIANDVVALAETLGTSQTIAALPDYARDQTIGAPATWWSGWAFEDVDQGLVLEYGTNYCFEAMNAVDWSVQAVPAAGLPEVGTIGVIFLPTDYGGDYAAGVAAAAEANGLETAWRLPVVPVVAGGDPNQVEAVTKVVSDPVDVVFMAVTPSETAPIVGGAVQQGSTSIFVGAAPTWNLSLLDTAAAPAFEAGIYFQSSFVGPWATETPGHDKMRATLESLGLDPQDFYVPGWVSQYPIKAALEAGVANGDLTKPGVAQAAVELMEVDFEGMMPAGQYSGDVADRVPRETIIGGYSADSPTGIEIVQDFFVGPTAAGWDFSEPCFAG